MRHDEFFDPRSTGKAIIIIDGKSMDGPASGLPISTLRHHLDTVNDKRRRRRVISSREPHGPWQHLPREHRLRNRRQLDSFFERHAGTAGDFAHSLKPCGKLIPKCLLKSRAHQHQVLL